jgi:hypothetical protein
LSKRTGQITCQQQLGKYLRFDRHDLQAYIDAKRAESRRQARRR